MAAVAGNVTVEDAAGIFTVGGTVRAGPSLETATVTPPAGARPDSVMLQVLVEPAVRLVGLHDSEERSTGLRVRVVVVERLKPAASKLAVMVTLWVVVMEPAVAVKVAELVQAATATNVGIVSRELLAFSCTFRGL
jgi:hypothetical protein